MIRRRSKKRAAQEREYSKLRAKYLEENPLCAVPECRYFATDIHHKAGRVGKNLTDVSKFLQVCREHHIEIEEHPQWAKEQGYSLSRLSAD